MNKIINLDCLEGMKEIETGSIDMILTDLPYGTTDCKWDSMIPLDLLWQQYNRIIKKNGAIVLTGAQPFTTRLIASNMRHFRYCWYWHKNQVTGFPFAKFQPLRCIEEAAVFYKAMPTYNPQGLIKLDKPKISKGKKNKGEVYDQKTLSKDTLVWYTNYPRQTYHIYRPVGPNRKPVR